MRLREATCVSCADTRVPLPTTCCDLAEEGISTEWCWPLAGGRGTFLESEAGRLVAFVLVPHHFMHQTRDGWVGQAAGRAPAASARCPSRPH